jgi:hypothetical protein
MKLKKLGLAMRYSSSKSSPGMAGVSITSRSGAVCQSQPASAQPVVALDAELASARAAA